MNQTADADNGSVIRNADLPPHSVVKLTVLRASEKCPVFRKDDAFFIRQHILDTDISTLKNFCFHTLFDLYPVYARVRKGEVGTEEIFDCRDKGMIQFKVERLADEQAVIGRSVWHNAQGGCP